MVLSQVDSEMIEPKELGNEVDDLKSRLVRLSEASIRISESLDTEAALQEALDSG